MRRTSAWVIRQEDKDADRASESTSIGGGSDLGTDSSAAEAIGGASELPHWQSHRHICTHARRWKGRAHGQSQGRDGMQKPPTASLADPMVPARLAEPISAPPGLAPPGPPPGLLHMRQERQDSSPPPPPFEAPASIRENESFGCFSSLAIVPPVLSTGASLRDCNLPPPTPQHPPPQSSPRVEWTGAARPPVLPPPLPPFANTEDPHQRLNFCPTPPPPTWSADIEEEAVWIPLELHDQLLNACGKPDVQRPLKVFMPELCCEVLPLHPQMPAKKKLPEWRLPEWGL